MKKIYLFLILIVVLFGVGWFLVGRIPKHKLTNDPNSTINAAREKIGDTTFTGKITKVGNKYFITLAGRQPKEIDSYSIKLGDYVGKTVTVTGQYSGDILFVGKIME